MEEYMSVGVHKTRHDDFASEIDIALMDFIIGLPFVHLGDAARFAVNSDGDILQPYLLLRIKKNRGMENHNFV